MKTVILNIKPENCELIINNEKIIEVRKNKPKIELPFKCLIYCSNGYVPPTSTVFSKGLKNKVIGEFICDKVITANYGNYAVLDLSQAALDSYDLLEYADEKTIYGWHVSNLIIYDKPKELKDFYNPCYSGCSNCKYCSWDYAPCSSDKELICTVRNRKPLEKFPTNWGYFKGGVN